MRHEKERGESGQEGERIDGKNTVKEHEDEEDWQR